MQRSFAVLLLFLSFAAARAQQSTESKPEPKVAVISADLGNCSADITVVDSRHRPVMNAKLATQVRYGFGGMRRTDLELYTNILAKARVEGLPEKLRRPLAFDVTFEGRQSALVVDTAQKCSGTYTAVIPDK